MQDRYTGDIGDYGKLGMLRYLAAAGPRVGVNWYRTPDEDHNEDGKFIRSPAGFRGLPWGRCPPRTPSVRRCCWWRCGGN